MALILFMAGLSLNPLLSQKPVNQNPNLKIVSDVLNPELNKRIVVKGSIENERGQALPGVTLILDKGNKGTTTDVNGNFELNHRIKQFKSNKIIVQYIGFETIFLNLDNIKNKEILIKMKEIKNKPKVIFID